MKVAVTGASGFIGNRTVEKFYLGNVHQVLPVAHSNSSLGLTARFDLPWKVRDHYSVRELSAAFEGCEAVIHAAFGTPLGKMSEAVYRAADEAGVRRLVVLSTATVYNQNPPPGTTEESPLPEKSATPYNANKIAADKVFRRMRAKGKTEIVFMMPGIVYGPRSMWTTRVAKQVMSGSAYFINGGRGICNAVYIDNLIEAIHLSLTAGGIDGEAFFVSDAETVTWADFYRPVLSAFGATAEDVHDIEEVPAFEVSLREQIREQVAVAVETETIKRVKPFVPPGLKKVYKTALSLALSNEVAPDDWAPLEEKTRPAVTLEMSLLQQSGYKLPNAKAERLLRYRPPVSFTEGMNRSIGWLKFAGYPVISVDGDLQRAAAVAPLSAYRNAVEGT